jgi:predicted lipid carrier protein YhbT
VATREEVDRTLRSLVGRLDDAEVDDAKLPSDSRRILCVVTDLGLTYRAEYAKGRIRKLKVVKSDEDGADVRITLPSDELISLAEGRSSLPMALLFGRIRVDANARDLLLLRQLF